MDDLDFPPEPPKLVDLHLGPAKVKAFKSIYHGPKPIGPGIMFLNVLIVVAALANLVLFFNVWKWIFV
jgi:hypothetical protein